MTCIVGWVDKNKDVYLGADSYATSNHNTLVLDTNKVFRNGSFIFGGCGSYRLLNVLEYSFKEPKRKANISDMDYLYNYFITSIIKLLTKEKCLKEKEKIAGLDGAVILFGYKGNLYGLDDDLQINKTFKHFRVTGCGQDFAGGAIHAIKDVDISIEEKLLTGLRIASIYNNTVGSPFHIIKMSKGGVFKRFPIYKE